MDKFNDCSESDLILLDGAVAPCAEQAQQGRYNALNPEGTMQAVSGLTQG